MIKTIKIADFAHTELKRFVANNPGKETMEGAATAAIMQFLKIEGHAFIPKDKKKLK